MAPSFLDDLRAVRTQVRAQAEKTLDVPGGGGKISVRFRPPTDPDAVDRLTAAVAAYRVGSALSRHQERQLIIDCAEEVLHRGEDGQLGSVEGGPLMFDASDDRWTDVGNAHDCVTQLYNLDLQPLACSGVADNLIDWLQGMDAEIQARVEGKSLAATAERSSPPQPA